MINDFRQMAHGVGGSHTRWQRKPPAHAVFWIDTDEGQTAITAYDVRGPTSERGVVVDEGATGPGNKPFKSEVDFGDLSEELRSEIEDRAVSHFEESDFFSDPS